MFVEKEYPRLKSVALCVARAQKNLSKHNVGSFDITVQLTVDASEIQENDMKKNEKKSMKKKYFSLIAIVSLQI